MLEKKKKKNSIWYICSYTVLCWNNETGARYKIKFLNLVISGCSTTRDIEFYFISQNLRVILHSAPVELSC